MLQNYSDRVGLHQVVGTVATDDVDRDDPESEGHEASHRMRQILDVTAAPVTAAKVEHENVTNDDSSEEGRVGDGRERVVVEMGGGEENGMGRKRGRAGMLVGWNLVGNEVGIQSNGTIVVQGEMRSRGTNNSETIFNGRRTSAANCLGLCCFAPSSNFGISNVPRAVEPLKNVKTLSLTKPLDV